MEIELLDGEGQPLRSSAAGGPPAPGAGARRSSIGLALAVGLAAAVVVVVVGGLVVGAVQGRMTDDLDRRIRAAVEVEAASLLTPADPVTPSDPAVAIQVLQSPGTAVSSSGPPADRAMTSELPPPGLTRTITADLTVGIATERYRVAVMTLPTSPGVAGRTVVAAALPLDPVREATRRLRLTFLVLAAAAGVAGGTATVALRRRVSG